MTPNTIRYIMVPLIGALIGYATNWLAVKMLFRPHYEVRIWGIKLPFTPGVIPKGQARMARAVGRAVEDQLLTEKVLMEVLLSEDMKKKLRDAADEWCRKKEVSEKTILEAVCSLIPELKVEGILDNILTNLKAAIYEKLLKANVGKLVATKVLETAREKLNENVFGMMIGGAMLDPIADLVEVRINDYVAESAPAYIEELLAEEMGKLTGKTVGELVSLPGQNGIDIPSLIVTFYENYVSKQLPTALSALNLSAIVENRINAMEVAEVEDLMMAIMKKELGAIVNLGALIGFVLGLVNVLILLI